MSHAQPPMPTPDEMAAAAKELADARTELDKAQIAAREARHHEDRCASRVATAADRLRGMADRLAPPPKTARIA